MEIDGHELRTLWEWPTCWASCSCGWNGPVRDFQREAVTDWREHVGIHGS